jgi:hypothetical protein
MKLKYDSSKSSSKSKSKSPSKSKSKSRSKSPSISKSKSPSKSKSKSPSKSKSKSKKYISNVLSPLKFKYTNLNTRLVWIENLYPIGYVIVNEISKIKWNKYEYEGITLCEKIYDEEKDEEINKEMYLLGKGKLNSKPYCFFGGVACELYSKFYPKVGNINDLVDPTSDIDVKISSPFFKPEEISYEEIDLVLIKENKYTDIIKHYTRWLFNEVVNICNNIKKYFNPIIFSLPDINDSEETMLSDLSENIGPMLITRSLFNEQNMIKIQVSTKIGDISDHFIEFVLPLPEKKIKLGGKIEIDNSIIKLENILIEEPIVLFKKQFEALTNRYNEDIDSNIYKHKFYNHCGRVLYISRLLIFMKKEKKLRHIAPHEFKKINLEEKCESYNINIEEELELNKSILLSNK